MENAKLMFPRRSRRGSSQFRSPFVRLMDVGCGLIFSIITAPR